MVRVSSGIHRIGSSHVHAGRVAAVLAVYRHFFFSFNSENWETPGTRVLTRIGQICVSDTYGTGTHWVLPYRCFVVIKNRARADSMLRPVGGSGQKGAGTWVLLPTQTDQTCVRLRRPAGVILSHAYRVTQKVPCIPHRA